MFIFLLCTERSGSNFLTNLLGGHKDISAPPPTHLFRLFGMNEKNYGDLNQDENWNILIKDVVENFDSKLGIWNTTVSAEELANNVLSRKSSELLRYIYLKEAESDNAENIFIKENNTYKFTDYLLRDFPDCKFVYMVRDPRDVASSWVLTDTIPGGTEKAVDTWFIDQEGASKFYDQQKSQGNIYLIKYEELVSDTVTCLQNLINYLEIEYDDGVLEYYQNPRTIANSERIDAWKNLSKPVLKGNSGKYKKNLSISDISYIEHYCRNLMARYGYICESIDETVALTRDEFDSKTASLINNISSGDYKIKDAGEKNIRSRRLKAINSVLQRKL